ncbi:dimethylaniline monooxygenase [Fistulifera solaris]|uniref:Dimethylaniline monooxygenase n=1 Tax=Fistulifera solaris TaxID=1519565 RepID=A0A1Z5JC02_FISSO|nr:dimethylaniline monooxygenase [Fistulifera solaris]|eukprot:GAX11517.1 dimethylaniline monooxygenase [Fistulifera solaris]
MTPQIAVIGGGAAGLAAARILTRDLPSCQITVLEQREALGGVWKYDKDKQQQQQQQQQQHPMYQNLRTNLPKEIMQFREYPWTHVDYEPGQPNSSFLTHRQVLQYLQNYAQQFGLESFIQFRAEVQQLTVLEGTPSIFQPSNETWPKIQLQWKEGNDSTTQSAIFDAVCICNGHYYKPAQPAIPGLQEFFHGEVLHSVSYNEPSSFAGKTILCIGGRASGSDIARELVTQGNAAHVYLSDSVCRQAQTTPNRVTIVPATTQFRPGGKVQFGADCPLEPTVDTVMFCTGYDYDFPFVQSSLVQADQRRVRPLYHQLWHAQYPNLAFIGLPHSVVPFPLFELQMEAFCSQLVNWRLGGLSERLVSAEKDASSGGVCRLRVPDDTHFLGDAQWDYCRQLAQFASLLQASEDDNGNDILNYIATNKAIYDHAGKARKSAIPGSVDAYKSLCYERNDSLQTFTSWSCEGSNTLQDVSACTGI